ncbi:response regulator [Halosimplex sp. TS25]|uniref:response regulator n=1 Tax=Halosimplex rarum TaxID=3396619 RepID=UPI0039E94201
MSNRFTGGGTPTADVLLVESAPEDAAPFIEAFESTAYTESVHVVTDGAAALDFLHRRGDYTDAPRPQLVLLDLHVHGPSGTEVLGELTDHDELRRVPVVAVKASDAADDVLQSYDLNANAYVVKPETSAEFEALAESIERFWLAEAKLPPR